MATKKPVVVKKTATSVTLWEQEMADAAAEQASGEKSTGTFKSISTKGGILSVDDNPVQGNEMRCIILTSIHENQMYPGAYNPSVPQTPICYAFGKDDATMAPHEAATQKQSDQCHGCPMNEFGSADTGKGKACKNVRRLLIIAEDSLENGEALKEAEMRMMKLPVMSVANWTNYVNAIREDFNKPSWGVITTIRLVPDAKSQFRVQFKFEEAIEFDEETYPTMKKRVAEADKNIVSAYPVFEEEAPQPKGRRVIPVAKAGAVKGRGKY